MQWCLYSVTMGTICIYITYADSLNFLLVRVNMIKRLIRKISSV